MKMMKCTHCKNQTKKTRDCWNGSPADQKAFELIFVFELKTIIAGLHSISLQNNLMRALFVIDVLRPPQKVVRIIEHPHLGETRVFDFIFNDQKIALIIVGQDAEHPTLRTSASPSSIGMNT